MVKINNFNFDLDKFIKGFGKNNYNSNKTLWEKVLAVSFTGADNWISAYGGINCSNVLRSYPLQNVSGRSTGYALGFYGGLEHNLYVDRRASIGYGIAYSQEGARELVDVDLKYTNANGSIYPITDNLFYIKRFHCFKVDGFTKVALAESNNFKLYGKIRLGYVFAFDEQPKLGVFQPKPGAPDGYKYNGTDFDFDNRYPQFLSFKGFNRHLTNTGLALGGVFYKNTYIEVGITKDLNLVKNTYEITGRKQNIYVVVGYNFDL